MLYNLIIFQGSTVNWSASLPPPHYVREEWASRYGMNYFNSQAFQAAIDRVSERIGATTVGVEHNVPNQILIEG